LIACFLNNISAKYYENPTVLSRVIAKNIGDVFFETQCICIPTSSCVSRDILLITSRTCCKTQWALTWSRSRS